MSYTRILIGAALAGAMAAAAGAQQLRTAPAGPRAHPAHHMYTQMGEYLAEESDGAMSTLLLGPEVVALPQMKDALQTGLVDVGNLLPLYFPADLPSMSLAGDLALIGRNPHAMAAAMTEYTVTCARCQEELSKFGVVFLGSGSSDVYVLLTTRPVRTAADLEGMRLRSGGAPFARFAENFGATPVALGVGDTFEAMSQGSIDGTMASIADLLSFRLVDVAKHVTVLPIGTYHATSNFTVAKPTWGGLSPEQRATLVAAANRANPDLTQRWAYEMPDAAMAAAEEAGIEIIEPDQALLDAAQTFADGDQEAAAAIAQERFGFDDADAEMDRFRALVEKWTAIVEETGPDPVAIAERTKSEIWDKVDLSTYGD